MGWIKLSYKNSQHNIDDQDGHHEQHAQPGERRLKCLRRALQAGADGGRQNLRGCAVHGGNGVAQRNAGFQVKADGHCRKLPQVIHRERPNFS